MIAPCMSMLVTVVFLEAFWGIVYRRIIFVHPPCYH